MLADITKKCIKAAIPHGILQLREAIQQRADRLDRLNGKQRYHSKRHKNIARVNSQADQCAPHVDPNDYQAIIQFLVNRGISEAHVRQGSIPQKSLEFLLEQLDKLVPPTELPTAIHIGNFLGVSLVYLSSFMMRRSEKAVTFAIDPNIPHRAIANPQNHVCAIINACGLQCNTMIVAGYSNLKSISNDGVQYNDYDPVHEFASEASCEKVLHNLSARMRNSCDVVLLDGNHDAKYLEKEVDSVLPLLKESGLIVFDDVDENWQEIKDVFANANKLGLRAVATDGRIGIAAVAR